MASFRCVLVLISFVFHNSKFLLKIWACIQPLHIASHSEAVRHLTLSCLLPRVEPPPLPSWGTGGAFEEVFEGLPPDLASVFLAVEGVIFLFYEKRRDVKTNNKWEVSQCISGSGARFLHLRFSQGIFLSRLCLRILIMIEPLHQSSLVRHLISLQLPAKSVQCKCQSWSLPKLLSLNCNIPFLFYFFSFLSWPFPKCLSLLQKADFLKQLQSNE